VSFAFALLRRRWVPAFAGMTIAGGPTPDRGCYFTSAVNASSVVVSVNTTPAGS